MDEPRFATIYDELVALMGDPFEGRQVERERAVSKRRRPPRTAKATAKAADKPEKTKPTAARP
jgi:hypothetical protein